MGGRKIVFWIGFAILVVVTLLNSFLHISFYGSGISFLYPGGISQIQALAGNFSSVNGLIYSSTTKQVSFIAICIELLLIILLLAFVSFRKRKVKKDFGVSTAHLHPLHTKSKTETDIDVLYRMLQGKKSIKLSTAVKIFKVDPDMIMEWCKILENADLATIAYPKVGEPEITLVK